MGQKFIEIKSANVNNLKNVSLQIPKDKITVFTGVSGSGKSSVVFDVIAQEAGRQLNETYSNFVRQFLPKYSRPVVDEIKNLSTAIVVDQKQLGGNARSTLGTISDINPLFRVLFSRFGTPIVGLANTYSFNDPTGMCETCEGIGRTITMNIDLAVDVNKSLSEGAIELPGFGVGTWQWKVYGESGFFDVDKKIKDYTEDEMQQFLYGSEEEVSISYKNTTMPITFEGLVNRFMRINVNRDKEATSKQALKMQMFTLEGTCPKCQGKRYNEKVLSSKIDGKNIYDLTAMQLDELLVEIKKLEVPPAAESLVRGILERVQNICDIGLSYMTLTRETPTLSGGESQRIKMVKYLSSDLVDLMYIFDEPSTGLHPRDVYRLNDLLKKLRDKGNTVLVVEHDPDVIKIADHIVDMGPLAGSNGGEIMYTGTYEGLAQSDTLTGKFLHASHQMKTSPRKATTFIESSLSSLHNLKNVQLRVPEGIFTAVTGVAGSGKSTLVNQVFAQEFPDIIRIDQSSVHTNSRSNPATFTGIMDPLRKAFAKENDVSNSLFSYNSEGACPECNGKGVIELNMSFMDATEVECHVCNGSRYREDVLHYTYKGKNIVEVMDMTVYEAVDFFDITPIKNKLKSLRDVGVGYLTLGQPLSTLSGGECQRIKLAKELNKKGNIYILDEPTTGLHMADIATIIDIINQLVDKGNTVIVIEHNLDVIRQSDWIIDLGPDGGSNGGMILYEGPSNKLSESKESITKKYI